MAGMFAPARPAAPPPPPPPPAPTKTDSSVEAARRSEVEAAGKARGRSASILTGGDGDTSAAPVTTKRLLGE